MTCLSEELERPKVPHTSFFNLIREYAAHLRAQVPDRPLRVLVVDDDSLTRRFVDRVLREAGFETAVAEDGPEAMTVAESFQPLDLVLTDLMMPDMNGDELARRLRTTEPGLKVLYLTGYSDLLFRERQTLWEDEAYLEKPCSATGLLEAVSLLSHGRLAVPMRPTGPEMAQAA